MTNWIISRAPRWSVTVLVVAAWASAACSSSPPTGLKRPAPAQTRHPIALHPENPHYFLWRGRPTVLISSAEHYGAVMNLDFDWSRYLDTLLAEGMNYTRVFSGAYVEPEGAFKIARNTLAPLPARYITPWARSSQPGYANGGNKFDLSGWDEAYFARLKNFVAYAASRNIVVELTLFCPMYEDMQWALSPMNAVNNVNGIGSIARTDVYTLDRHGGLLEVQVALVRRIVTELNRFDNVVYEICNEPYFGGVTMAWQHHIADTIVEAERELPSKHLIAQNIANKSAQIVDPHPAVSIFNFHYATPPDAVAANYALNKVIGDDETGFRGVDDVFYRSEAWEFVLAGGGLYNNLDYSFVSGHEDGTFAYPPTQPGGGSHALRQQLKVLRDFIDSVDFVHMSPDNSVIEGGIPPGGVARALVKPGAEIAIYLRKPLPPATRSSAAAALEIELPDGVWRADWVTMSGHLVRGVDVRGGGVRTFESPAYEVDIALRVKRR
jgi:Cellulase (glycosyl hydrolase family 5)